MLRTLLNGQLSGRSGLYIPAGLKMSEGVVELILFAEDIAGAESHAPIDALDGLVRPSTQGMRCAQKAVGVCKVGACMDGPTEGADCLRIMPVRDAYEAARKVGPGFTRVARDRAIRAFRRSGEGSIAVLPTLKRAPGEADGAQAVPSARSPRGADVRDGRLCSPRPHRPAPSVLATLPMCAAWSFLPEPYSTRLRLDKGRSWQLGVPHVRMNDVMSVSREDLRRYLQGLQKAQAWFAAERRRRLATLTEAESRAEYDALVGIWEASPRDGDQAALDRLAIHERVELRRKLRGCR